MQNHNLLFYSHFPKLLTIVLFSILSFNALFAQQPDEAKNCEQLNEWLSENTGEYAPLRGEKIKQETLLLQFYHNRSCTPAWSDAERELENAEALIEWLRNETTEPHHYHFDRIEERYTEIIAIYLPVGLFDHEELSPFDVWLTDAALRYMYETAAGGATLGDEEETELLRLLDSALEKGEIAEIFGKLHNEGLEGTQATTPLPDDKPVEGEANEQASGEEPSDEENEDAANDAEKYRMTMCHSALTIPICII